MEKKEQNITNSKELSVAVLDALLAHKDEKITYGDVVKVIIKSSDEFQKVSTQNPNSQLGMLKLKDFNPEALFNVVLVGLTTNILSGLLFKCSPDEAKDILARTKTSTQN